MCVTYPKHSVGITLDYFCTNKLSARCKTHNHYQSIQQPDICYSLGAVVKFLCLLFLPVDLVLERLCCCERRKLASWDIQFFTSSRIASFSCSPRFGLEGSKTNQCDFLIQNHLLKLYIHLMRCDADLID